MDDENIKKSIDFLLIAGQCKNQKRTGWINHHVQLPESICDHMYRMAIACLLLNQHPLPSSSSSSPLPSLNISRCLLLCLVHDIGESITGDIVPMDPMGKEEKQRRERLAMETIRDTLLPNPAGTEIFEAWQEYEKQATNEAKVVKDLDRLEMIVQSLEYEKAQNIDLSTFYDSVRGKLRHPVIQLWGEEVEKRRTIMNVTDAKKTPFSFYSWSLNRDVTYGIGLGFTLALGFLYIKQRLS